MPKKAISKSDFSVNEVCAIIRTCQESGVTRLKIGAFEASFLPPKTKASEVATPTPEQLEAAREFQNEAFLDNERRIKQRDLSELRLSDPEAYEELVNRGELENAREEPDGTNP